jgi:hypothetical protein
VLLRTGLRWVALFVAVGMIVVLVGIASFYPAETAFDFRLFNSGSNSNVGGIIVARGHSGTITVTVSLVKGSPRTVALSCGIAGGPLPLGLSCSFAPESGLPSYNATLSLRVSLVTPKGYYAIQAIGTAGNLVRLSLFTLTVI